MAASLRCLSFARILPFVKNHIPAFSMCLTSPKRQLSYGQPQIQETVPDFTKIEDEQTKEVIAKVNNEIENKSHGRLFAVVYILGLQYRVTQDDLIVINKVWPPTLGDVIRLEKVLLLGCRDFTLIGRPLLPKDQVSVIATVIEKRLSHTTPKLSYTPKAGNTKTHFYKSEYTFLRINSITVNGKVNELGNTEGLADRIF